VGGEHIGNAVSLGIPVDDEVLRGSQGVQLGDVKIPEALPEEGRDPNRQEGLMPGEDVAEVAKTEYLDALEGFAKGPRSSARVHCIGCQDRYGVASVNEFARKLEDHSGRAAVRPGGRKVWGDLEDFQGTLSRSRPSP